MTFAVGESVVYPSHGAALVEGIQTRQVKGDAMTYLVLRVAHNGMLVHVPACNLDLVGVRRLVDDNGVERIFAVLRADCTDDSLSWSARYRANTAKLRSGGAHNVAEVVRDLWRREQEHGLSAAERRMLLEARHLLVSELALRDDTGTARAEALVDEALAG
jgi:CarD family transcriptional regulator